MFATNFTIDDKFRKFVRGEKILKTFSQSASIETGNTVRLPFMHSL